MAWDILNVEPAYGKCDVCSNHQCGIVDGKHMWIRTGMRDRYGDELIVGYNCVKLWSENLGISKQVVEKEVQVSPTESQLADYLLKLMENQFHPNTPEEDKPKRQRKVNADA